MNSPRAPMVWLVLVLTSIVGVVLLFRTPPAPPIRIGGRHSLLPSACPKEAQRLLLTSHPCDYMQGFLFIRPVPAHAALAFIQARNAR